METIIYNFQGEGDGAFPNGVTFDSSGNLDGTTVFRGRGGWGTVFSLAPDGHGGWTESTLYGFTDGANGGSPEGGVIFDSHGDLLGTTSDFGSGNGGTVWQLSSLGGGRWLLDTLTSFNYSGTLFHAGPASSLTMDAVGNLYGTTVLDGAYNQGSVFKLTPSDGGWTLTVLHDFTGGADGGQPWGQVSLDGAGNLYGTADIGGQSVGDCYQNLGCGVVWEITP